MKRGVVLFVVLVGVIVGCAFLIPYLIKDDVPTPVEVLGEQAPPDSLQQVPAPADTVRVTAPPDSAGED